jgi:hypothetical protein
MIEMRVRVHDQLDVFHAKAGRADIGDDLRHRFGQCSVDEHVAGLGGHEENRQAVRANVVRVAVHLERLLRLVPPNAIGTGGRTVLSGYASRQQKKQHDSQGQQHLTGHGSMVDQIPRAHAAERMRESDNTNHRKPHPCGTGLVLNVVAFRAAERRGSLRRSLTPSPERVQIRDCQRTFDSTGRTDTV